MSGYTVVEVKSRRDLRRFIRFPLDLYRDCPQYVPALNFDQRRSLTKTVTLKYCMRKMWLAVDGDGRVVGRICGMINPRYNERYGTRRARFGWFDVIDDIEVARLLVGTAQAWAKENGMDEIHGPLYYNTLGKQGMLVEGYENIPPFNCLYNYPYYNDLLTELGFVKECDWVQYRMDATQEVPERMRAIAARVQENYGFTPKSIDKLKKDKALVRKFYRMYSDSFAESVYNFIPFTDEEIDEEQAQTMSLLKDRLCVFLFDRDDEIAVFGVSFPSISKALQKCRGRLFPFGWWHLLRAYRSNECVDLMLNGAAPKWQNTGISAVCHCVNAERFRSSGVKWAISNPQLENNSATQVWARYQNEPYMRRRCYIKKI